MTTLRVRFDIFQPLISLTIDTKYDSNWELPLVRDITFSFVVWILCVLSSFINCVLFCSYFCVWWARSCIFVFSWAVLSFKWWIAIFGFYLLYYPWRFFFFFIGSLLALKIPDFVGISSCQIYFSICITSFFLLLQQFSLVGVSNSVVSFSCCVSYSLLCCNIESISLYLVVISSFRNLFSASRSFIL